MQEQIRHDSQSAQRVFSAEEAGGAFAGALSGQKAEVRFTPNVGDGSSPD